MFNRDSARQADDEEHWLYCANFHNFHLCASRHWRGLFKIQAVCQTENRKSLFVSMNTQAIKASIIQAACREKPLLAVHWRFVPRLLMLFRPQQNNTNATELLEAKQCRTTAAQLELRRPKHVNEFINCWFNHTM